MQSKTLIHLCCILTFLAGLAALPAAGQAAPQSGAVSGVVTYSGEYDPNHEVLVSAHLQPEVEPVASVHIPGPGAYTLTDLPDGSYYLSAFLDIHDRGEGPPEFGEPTGWYDPDEDGNPDPVVVSGNSLTGIDIHMTDLTEAYIQGTACYLGGVTGPGSLEVALHLNPENDPVVSLKISLPCSLYSFSGGPPGSYYISLYYDVNDSGGPPDPGEPVGWYDPDGDGSPDPVNYTGEVITGLDITLGQVHYVDYQAAGEGTGTSWTDAYTDLQEALSAAGPGEEIWVAAGIYTPGADRAASFVLPHGVAVYGGFNGGETYRNQRNWRANATLLSGEIGDLSTTVDNSYHVVTTASTWENPLDGSAILDGFTITGGRADGWGPYQDTGGGLLNDYGSPTLANLNFSGNYAASHGGALANQFSGASPTLINATFSGNQAGYNAGGIANLGQAGVILLNSTLVGNSGANGGGIVNLQGSHAEVHNSILWGNPGGEIALQDTSTAEVTYSIITGGYPGGSQVLDLDPLLVDADGPDNIYGSLDDDLHLGSSSPAIDAGDNSAAAADPGDSDGDSNFLETSPLDLDGGARRVDEPAAADSGNGSAPLVDLGADEYAPPDAISSLQAAVRSPIALGEAAVLSARVASGSHVSYSWDLGDGSSAAGGAVAHRYTAPGVYPLTLTASNSLGSQRAHTTVTVYEDLTLPPGGETTTTDGVLGIAIPASISGSVTITYTPQVTPTGALGSYAFAGLAFRLEAADEGGDPLIAPSEPFSLTVQYEESALPVGMDEQDLALHRYDEAAAAWVALEVVERDPANDRLTVLLDHFSEFALLVEEASAADQFIHLPLVIR